MDFLIAEFEKTLKEISWEELRSHAKDNGIVFLRRAELQSECLNKFKSLFKDKSIAKTELFNLLQSKLPSFSNDKATKKTLYDELYKVLNQQITEKNHLGGKTLYMFRYDDWKVIPYDINNTNECRRNKAKILIDCQKAYAKTLIQENDELIAKVVEMKILTEDEIKEFEKIYQTFCTIREAKAKFVEKVVKAVEAKIVEAKAVETKAKTVKAVEAKAKTVKAVEATAVAEAEFVDDKCFVKKYQIPKKVRTDVWNTYIGQNIPIHKCLCCKLVLISMTAFDVGHVIAEKNGGTATIVNLRPICSSCNTSMGTRDMRDYVISYGYLIG